MADSDDYFEVIDSEYELITSIKEDSKIQNPCIYEVTIKPSTNDPKLILLEDQYYNFVVMKEGLHFAQIKRRYSEFAVLFEVLNKNQAGYIFPAFPQNGIFAFMKSKVTFTKDLAFILRRIRVIERFFTKIFNDPLFDPQFCKEVQEFLSSGNQFEARKELEKNNQSIFGYAWNLVKGYVSSGKQEKYEFVEKEVAQLKVEFERLYAKCRQLIDLLRQEKVQNAKLEELQENMFLSDYLKMIKEHDQLQSQNLKQLEELQFVLFCQNQDLSMANKLINRITELKNGEDNEKEVACIEEKFQPNSKEFLIKKAKTRLINEGDLTKIIENIKKVARIGE